MKDHFAVFCICRFKLSSASTWFFFFDHTKSCCSSFFCLILSSPSSCRFFRPLCRVLFTIHLSIIHWHGIRWSQSSVQLCIFILINRSNICNSNNNILFILLFLRLCFFFKFETIIIISYLFILISNYSSRIVPRHSHKFITVTSYIHLKFRVAKLYSKTSRGAYSDPPLLLFGPQALITSELPSPCSIKC